MRRSLFIILGVVLLIGVVVAGWFYYLHRDSPRYVLLQILEAIRERNYDKIYYHIDLKNIIDQLIQDTGQDLLSRNGGEQDELTRLGQNLARKFARHLLPRLFANFEKDLRQAINGYLSTLTSQEILALEAAVALAEVSQTGGEAQVTLKFPKEELRLRLTMSRDFPDRSWRVVGVNFQDLKKIIKKELL
jgi:hypothetical protein|uniref:DUF2939 domain-containing protein n=1 Tax=Desulfobacca acetoxidans TaxID=60893 RepID=A0A7C5AK62_9BACT